LARIAIGELLNARRVRCWAWPKASALNIASRAQREIGRHVRSSPTFTGAIVSTRTPMHELMIGVVWVYEPVVPFR